MTQKWEIWKTTTLHVRMCSKMGKLESKEKTKLHVDICGGKRRVWKPPGGTCLIIGRNIYNVIF